MMKRQRTPLWVWQLLVEDVALVIMDGISSFSFVVLPIIFRTHFSIFNEAKRLSMVLSLMTLEFEGN